jgi:hypothetical protein
MNYTVLLVGELGFIIKHIVLEIGTNTKLRTDA